MLRLSQDQSFVAASEPAIRRKVRSLVSRLTDWFAANARDLPWRHTTDPYAIWVSEIMLQQTQVKTVIPYFERWMKVLPDVRALSNTSSQKLHKLWEGLGYYTRVRNMQRAARQIVKTQKHPRSSRRRRGDESQINTISQPPHVGSCSFPENFDDILALPGIGRYTAGAICSIAFNQPTPVLDGNVTRVLSRVFGIRTDPRERRANAILWQLAEALVSEAANPEFTKSKSEIRDQPTTRRSPRSQPVHRPCSALNQSLMEVGAVICLPRNPLCPNCPVRKFCVARRDSLVNYIPATSARPQASNRLFRAYIVRRRGRYLIRQRPEGALNAHLWEFPNDDVTPPLSGDRERAINGSRFKIATPSPLCTIKHSITRYRITLEAFPAKLTKPGIKGAGKWATKSELLRLPFTSAHRKIINALPAAN